MLICYARVRFASGASAEDYTSSNDSAVPLGRLLEENSALHVCATTDALIFRPRIGDVITGRVQTVSNDHIALLVAGIFNATLHAKDLAPFMLVDSDGVLSWESNEVADVDETGVVAKRRRSGSFGESVDVAHADDQSGVTLATNPRRIVLGSTVAFRVVQFSISTTGLLALVGSLSSSTIDVELATASSSADKAKAPTDKAAKKKKARLVL